MGRILRNPGILALIGAVILGICFVLIATKTGGPHLRAGIPRPDPVNQALTTITGWVGSLTVLVAGIIKLLKLVGLIKDAAPTPQAAPSTAAPEEYVGDEEELVRVREYAGQRNGRPIYRSFWEWRPRYRSRR